MSVLSVCNHLEQYPQIRKTGCPAELNNGLSLPVELDDTGVTLC